MTARQRQLLSLALIALIVWIAPAGLLAQAPAGTQAATSANTAPTPSAALVPAPVFDQVDEMLAALSEITGWEVKRDIPSEILSRADFAKTIEEGLEEAEGDEDLRAAELTLKMFGLTPWDFDLARNSADLIEEQAAAFYDFRKKRLFILDSTQEGLEQRVALVHELAHALADQQYPLEKYLDQAKTDDETTARQAVIEGQATWLSWAYLSYSAGGSPEVPILLLDQLAGAAGATGDAYPVLSGAPLYIRESLVFPYTEGMRFQDAFYRQLGPDAFDYVFRRPPRATQQIMHPQSYGVAAEPLRPKLPKPGDWIDDRSTDRLRKLIEGDVGEFDYSILLRQYIRPGGAPDASTNRAREAASHWMGGSYALYEHRDEKYPLLVHAAEWDSPEAAETFFQLYRDVLRAKWKRFEVTSEVTSETGGEVSGTGDTGDFLLRFKGTRVEAIEGVHRLTPPVSASLE